MVRRRYLRELLGGRTTLTKQQGPSGERGERVMAPMIVTPRLVPATARLLRAALESDAALAVELGAIVPQTWPPEFLDRSALEFTLTKVDADPACAPWWMSFIVLGRDASPKTLIGTAGFKGPRSGGSVEIGYGIVREFQRRGFAARVSSST